MAPRAMTGRGGDSPAPPAGVAPRGGASHQAVLPPPPPPGSPPPLPARGTPATAPQPMATIDCPRCRARLSFPDRARGKLVRCGGCGSDFDAVSPAASAAVSAPGAAASGSSSRVLPAPASGPRGWTRGDGSAVVFDLEGQWGTVANTFHPAIIYHGTQLKGDVSLPIAIAVGERSIDLGIRDLTPAEVRSFVVQYLPWLVATLLAPLQHFFGVVITPLLVMLSLLNPLAIPSLVADGVGHALAILPSISLLFTVIPAYVKALVAMVSGGSYTFVPTAVALEDGRLASLIRGECAQVIRLEVSQRLIQRVVRKVRKAEEEDMGLVGIVIGLVRLALLPITLPLSILSGVLRLFGVGRKRRAMFAFVVGNPVDLQAPTGFFSRFKKAREEAAAEEGRTVFLVNVPIGRADELGQAVARALGIGMDVVDDARAKSTIWRGYT